MRLAEPSYLCGLIGSGIGASRTPAMHEREAAEQGLKLIYRLIDLEPGGLGAADLPALLTAAERFGFAGLNVTHPCKQAVVPLLHDLSPEAEALGAVNTVVLHQGRRTGHNTDWWGFAENFRRRMGDVLRRRVVQFGAGGAGAAVAYALLTLGVERLSVVDVEPSRADAVATALCARFGPGRALPGSAADVTAADGIVNTTPLGMDQHPGMPLAAGLLRSELWVCEIVYFPIETALLRAARAVGCRTLDGGGMAVFQAAGAFRLFTGTTPDAERMLRHFATIGAAARST